MNSLDVTFNTNIVFYSTNYNILVLLYSETYAKKISVQFIRSAAFKILSMIRM